ncbi:MAG: putative Ig domain-containing protein, partial [Novosphingobium sp.]
TVNEGNAGITNATVTVSLSAPAGPGGVTFNITTANGSATAGSDYVAQSLTAQTIPAGSSTYVFTVLLNGDLLNEPSETFFVNVTGVINAVVVDGQGVGTIGNDDPVPSLSINDVTVVEGNAGTVNAVFTVTLNAASGQTVAVNFATADGTATQPADYTSTAGTLTFTSGQTTRTITVPVIGETVPEANETFFVNISGATNATLSDNQGLGTVTNDDVPVTMGPATLPNGAVAAAYSQTVSAAGGTGPYTYAVSAGVLPTGLTLSSGGLLSGTPTAGGTFSFTITGTDSSSFPGPFSGSQAYTVNIAAPTIALPATSLAGGLIGSAYSASITPASGGTSPYTYAVTAGALPGGLTLNPSSGAITGTPSALGTFNFTIAVTDSSTGTGPYTASQAYSIQVIDVAPVPASSTLTVAYNAAATNVPLLITGGTATSVAIGTAPLRGTVVVSGTTITYQPNAGYAGSDSFTYTASNSGGTSAPATVTVTVQDPVITITPTGGFNATVAAPYTQTFTFNGGAQPWSGYQVTNLPAGLAVTGTSANTVTVSGTPTQAGTFNLNVSATDSSTGNGPFVVGQAFALSVAAPTLSLSPAAGTFNAPYAAAFSRSFTASGGVGPYSYALSGTLPAGLSFAGGTLSGTPTVAGSFPITVTATDTG